MITNPYDDPAPSHESATAPECAWCGLEFEPGEAVDKTGTLHFEPCAGEARAAEDDAACDRMRDRQALYAVKGGSPLGAVKP